MIPQFDFLERIALLATTPLSTITEPTVVLSNSLTNFGPPSSVPARDLSPPLPLFNTALGTLVDVRVTATTTVTSNIKAQNTSTTAGASITANTQGSTALDFHGANSAVPPITSTFNESAGPVTVSAFTPGTSFDFAPPAGVSFNGVQQPAPTATNSQSFTYTDPAILALFSETAAQRTIPVTMSASATATAEAPNGNLTTVVSTLASATVSVSYDYIPAPVAPTRVIRFGVHRQQTQLVVTFNAPLNPTIAQDPNYYTIIIPGEGGSFTALRRDQGPDHFGDVQRGSSNTVTLISSMRLNFRYKYELSVNFPSDNGTPSTIVFGGKLSLGGFTGEHHKTFFPVVGGHLVVGGKTKA